MEFLSTSQQDNLLGRLGGGRGKGQGSEKGHFPSGTKKENGLFPRFSLPPPPNGGVDNTTANPESTCSNLGAPEKLHAKIWECFFWYVTHYMKSNKYRNIFVCCSFFARMVRCNCPAPRRTSDELAMSLRVRGESPRNQIQWLRSW